MPLKYIHQGIVFVLGKVKRMQRFFECRNIGEDASLTYYEVDGKEKEDEPNAYYARHRKEAFVSSRADTPVSATAHC